jgi:hypothetical protein
LLGDSFHLLQAILRRIRQHHSGIDGSQAMVMVRILWASPTKDLFDTNLDIFLAFYTAVDSSFVTYFKKTWIRLNPPESWAFYPRAGLKLPTGMYKDVVWILNYLIIRRSNLGGLSFAPSKSS